MDIENWQDWRGLYREKIVAKCRKTVEKARVQADHSIIISNPSLIQSLQNPQSSIKQRTGAQRAGGADQQTTEGTCSFVDHDRNPIKFICLEESCPSKMGCSYCFLEHHNKIDSKACVRISSS
jgi:hypothetical protein